MSQDKPLRYGVNNMYYAVKNDDGTYKAPVRMRGVRQITISAEGSTEKFYADNGVYYVTDTNAGRSGSVELAGLNDQALVDLFGYVVDANGVVLEDSDAKATEVALLFDCENDGPKPTKFAMYSVKFTRPSEEHNTKEESASPDTIKMDYEAIPIEVTYAGETRHFVGGHIDHTTDTASAYNAWYTAVTMPASSVTPSVTLNKAKITLVEEAFETLVATTVPAGETVTWTSGDEANATVDSSGKVTAVAEGDAIIYATITVDDTDYQASCEVVVTASV